jgi:hypothetical protein
MEASNTDITKLASFIYRNFNGYPLESEYHRKDGDLVSTYGKLVLSKLISDQLYDLILSGKTNPGTAGSIAELAESVSNAIEEVVQCEKVVVKEIGEKLKNGDSKGMYKVFHKQVYRFHTDRYEISVVPRYTRSGFQLSCSCILDGEYSFLYLNQSMESEIAGKDPSELMPTSKKLAMIEVVSDRLC